MSVVKCVVGGDGDGVVRVNMEDLEEKADPDDAKVSE